MKSKKEFPKKDYQELKEELEKITDTRDRILLKTIYAGCARVGEVSRNRYHNTWQSFGFEKLKISPGLLLLNLKTEKTHLDRRVPLSRIDNPNQVYFKKNEAWLTEDLINFYSIDKKFVWNISTRRTQQIFEKYFPEHKSHIHLLRHWRATHLRQGAATGVPLPMDIIKKIGGWTSTKVPEQLYEHSIIEDYIDVDF